MSELSDPLQQRKRQVIATAFGINVVLGALLAVWFPGLMDPATSEATFEALLSSPFRIGFQLLTLLFCFLWLGLDSRQLDIRRPWWLNVGVVVFTSVFIPYYLYKTRPKELRVRAILSFFAVLFVAALSMSLGVFISQAVSPNLSGTVAG